MESKDSATQTLKEHEAERDHQIIVINQMQSFCDGLASQGFEPLGSFLARIFALEMHLTALEAEIETLKAS